MLRLARVLAPERDAGAVAVRTVCPGAPQRLDGLHGATAEGRGTMTPRLVVVNEAAWKSLSASQQDILRASLAAFGKEQDDEIVRQENSLVDTFKQGGMIVTPIDVDSFRKPVLASVPGKFEAKWGKGLWERVVSA